MFAARILMPLCVLKELNVHLPEEIVKICNVSLEAATYRLKRLREKLNQNKFYISAFEIKVVENFKDFIQYTINLR